MKVRSEETILKPPSIVNPGVLGRMLRIGIGVLQIWFITQALPYFDHYVNTQPNSSWVPYLIAIAIALNVFPLVVNLGFQVKWGNRFRRGYFALLAGAIVIDLFVYGSLWGPPLGLLLFMMGVYVHAHLGVAHILAGLLGTPGCEMRAYAHLASILQKKDPTEAALCPGMWTPLDKWETSGKIEPS